MLCDTKGATDYMYCVCSGNYVETSDTAAPLTCKSCKKLSHRPCTCYLGPDEDFECSLCQVQLLDPFNNLLEFLWYGSMGSKTAVFKVDIPDLEKWESQHKDAYIISLPLPTSNVVHEWPKTLELRINKDVVHTVKEPSWGHSRRDNPIKITYAMQPGVNLFEISSTTYPETLRQFLIIIAVSKRVAVERIIETVKKRRTIPSKQSKQRILELMSNQRDDDDVICIEQGQKIELNCPITLSRMELPTRGKHCRHVQCFDLYAYLQVMQNMSTLNARWKCPECQLIVKPIDLVIDGYVLQILKTVPQCTSAIELDKFGNYKGIKINGHWRDFDSSNMLCNKGTFCEISSNTIGKSIDTTNGIPEKDCLPSSSNLKTKLHFTDALNLAAQPGVASNDVVVVGAHERVQSSFTSMSPQREVIILDSSDDEECQTTYTYVCTDSKLTSDKTSPKKEVSFSRTDTATRGAVTNTARLDKKKTLGRSSTLEPSTLSQRLNRLPKVAEPPSVTPQCAKRGILTVDGTNGRQMSGTSKQAGTQATNNSSETRDDTIKRVKQTCTLEARDQGSAYLC
ncbi:E3 SUMO-protein ligase pli1 [Babesia sp. Xinjiang]|uniref:E3 SUMO-protein ligase pli1 n=1 Tax=Babesia sp. Xinjiang TaxID=462227 RepID=UPI000A23B9D0|nr:E3 SUMO-protein ligase pli1 [Babesia sp. Xinjiang]ORM40773.1 E3 SUMO-protein ligase pli1 [Babesia sp. Xinjiang]